MPNFFSTKYMFAIMPTNKAAHNNKKLKENSHLHIKTRPPVIWFIDIIMRYNEAHTEIHRIHADLLNLISH